MIRVLALLGVACCVLAHDSFEEIGVEIAGFTADLINFQDELDNNIAKAVNVREQTIELTGRVATLEGSGCDDRFQFQCGGDVPTCISRLLVCDNQQDCPNSMEESQCRIFTPAGSNWKGTFYWDTCTSRKPKEMFMHINSYYIPNELRSFPEVSADMSMSDTLEDFSYSTTFRLDGVMDLLPGAHILYFHPPESDGLAIQCTFDGVKDDHCHGEVLYVISQQTCARFFMERID